MANKEQGTTYRSERIFSDFILILSKAKYIFHDQGKEFAYNFSHQLTKLLRVKKLRITHTIFNLM